MALPVKSKAPDFELTNAEGKKISLSDALQQNKHVLLLFFPLAFSEVCTKELCQVRDNLKIYDSLNAVIFGISVDSFFTLKEFKKSQNLNFQLLSDFNKEVSKKYEALYEDFFGMKGVSKRAAYIINKEGVIQYAEVLDDAAEIPDFEEISRHLKNSGE